MKRNRAIEHWRECQPGYYDCVRENLKDPEYIKTAIDVIADKIASEIIRQKYSKE